MNHNAGRGRVVIVGVTWHSQPSRAAGWCAALISATVLSAAVLAGCGSSSPGTAGASSAPSVRASGASPGSASAGSASPGTGANATSSPATIASAAPDERNVYRHSLLNPRVTVTQGSMFVTWQVSPPGQAAVRSELARVNTATGTVEAARLFTGFLDQVLEARGSLWVIAQTSSTPASETLLTLNPLTLRMSGEQSIGSGGESAWAAQTLAIAGGWLWADGGNRLLRLSPRTGTVTASIVLPGAASSDVSAAAAGAELIVGEADNEGRGAVQRRDAATGALLASHPVEGVAAPTVAGPVGSAVWISEATGMMGYVQRLDATSMRPEGSTCDEGRVTATCVFGTNGITARLADGLLWITQVAGGSQRNYCARPVSGRAIAPVVLPRPSQDIVLGIASDRIFYAAPGANAGEYLRQVPVPAACTVGRSA
jgi:hypothetical protein